MSILNDATILTDSILELRRQIASGTTDPISATRETDSKWVETAYPKRPTNFPFIVISDESFGPTQNLGPGIESQKIEFTFMIDIFATKVGYDATGRDRIWNDVFDALRTRQFGINSSVSGTHLIGLHDFKLLTTRNIDEPGITGLRRKQAIIKYDYYTG